MSTIDVLNPWTGECVGSVPSMTKQEVNARFEQAQACRPRLSRHQRQTILLNTAGLIRRNVDRLARLITAESGLCLKDSHYEVGRAEDVWAFAAQRVLHDDGETHACDISAHGQARRIFTERRPLLGVIGAITPFNHPLNMVSHKLAPAVATNNRCVLKPTEQTPLTALALAELMYEAGLPRDMLHVVTGDPATVGEALVTDPDCELVTFTGSVSIGHHIARLAGPRRCILELGGNDPLIIMADADLQRAADLAVLGATRNSGQRCTAVKRILVVDSVADGLVSAILERTRNLRCGDPMDPATDVGTVISATAAEDIARRVHDAVSRGARLLHGGERYGALLPPCVLDHVPPDCELVREETFGPVIPVIRVPDDIEAIITIANSTAFGLSSGVCTQRMDHIMRFVEALDVGTVNIWEVPGYRTEMSPFGGIKHSGNGIKEGIIEAMRAYTTVRTWSLPWGGNWPC
ncbi:MAG: phosphonoacetaldehyde dehydrogenase [Castellaniella sp.]